MTSTQDRSALEGIRVLDLTTAAGEAAGRVLADLGAEVIKIEPPGGCEARFTPPFQADGEGAPEGSLYWRSWGLGKRSVVLDLSDAADADRLRALAKGADILIESFTPGTLDALGLGADALRALNPMLLVLSITPFGQTGPYARHPATDITLAAGGGLINMQGDGDRPPIPVGFPETVHLGAVQGAADVILALYDRNRCGEGQHLDSSIQAAVLWSLMYVTGYAALEQNPPGFGDERAHRVTGQEVHPGIALPVCEPCKDGFVVMTLVLGAQGAFGFNAVMQHIAKHGGLDADLMEVEWASWLEQVQAGTLSVEDANRGLAQFKAYLLTMTKAEIQRNAVAQKWLIAPVYLAPDLLGDPQLESRDYWVDVAGDTFPGPFAKFSRTPIRYASPAPKLGQDQALVEGAERVPAQPRSHPSTPLAPRKQLFEGLKVADLSWIAAGPLISKDLANLGATVLRAETETRIDTLRFLPPFVGDPGVRTGHTYANMNQSKYNVAIDLSKPEGLAIAHRMIEWADVVVENFTPGTAERMGIGYDTLSKINPGIVMLYTCMRGQTGPEAAHTGFGLHGAALGGFVGITGWPDRKPQAPWGAYTDFISPRYALSALAAALYHRDRTGEGQCIDLSQIEAAIHYLTPALLDFNRTGRVIDRAGMTSERGCPHGTYPAAEAERYVAIETRTADEWRALCELVPGLAELGSDELSARLARREEIDAALSAWTAQQPAFEVGLRLREAGVPAYPVLRATDFHDDPQLASREFFVELDHEVMGPLLYDGPVTRFSRTPTRPLWAGPTIGKHTFEVLQNVLGYSEDEIGEFAAAGALS